MQIAQILGEHVTISIIVGVTVILIIYDIIVAALKPRGDTITQVLQKYSQKYPAIPFAFGFIIGHIFGDF